tara:strand:+ start:345 stop:791 length:447 start_codon:yes stop_codon:yes gene_type:complete
MKYSRFFRRTFSDIIRDFSSFGNPLIILILYLFVIPPENLRQALYGIIIVIVVCYTIKLIFNKERPKKIDHTNILELLEARSFPSAHSAQIMYSGLVLMKFINNKLLDILVFLIILVVGYSRSYLKKHYVIDIIFGYIIGLGIYLLMF